LNGLGFWETRKSKETLHFEWFGVLGDQEKQGNLAFCMVWGSGRPGKAGKPNILNGLGFWEIRKSRET